MLDVHPPHHSAGNLKEFFLHLFTITVGLLIAVGIEGCVERHEHHKLAADAAETMRAEIETNSRTMQNAIAGIATEQKAIQANIDSIQKIQQHPEDPAAQNASLSGDFGSVELRSTSWNTAQQTNALAYMPYNEAERFSEIYATQTAFLTSQNQLEEDTAAFFGLIRRFDPDHRPFSRDAADALAERFGIWQMHLTEVDIRAKSTLEHQRAFLENRKAATDFSEKIKN